MNLHGEARCPRLAVIIAAAANIPINETVVAIMLIERSNLIRMLYALGLDR